MGDEMTFFVATDEELDVRFPGWAPPTEGRLTDALAGRSGTTAATRRTREPRLLGSPSFRDDVWGPALPPIRPARSDGEDSLQQDCEPGLATLPHWRSNDAIWFVSADDLVHVLLETDEPGATPPLRVGSDEDIAIPCVYGFTPSDARALAEADDDRLDELAWELLGEASDEDEVEVSGEDWTHVRRELRALRALARKATKRGARLRVYVTL